MSSLRHKHIILGITGSIAAYKSAELARRLTEQGACVRVVMTENAKRFITPLTMQAVSGHPVHDDLFDLAAEAAMGHIELARWADCILIAPASANVMAKLALGQANDLLTTLCLATQAQIFLAPAMNQAMWHHPLTQTHLHSLQKQTRHILGPAAGDQACGDTGLGRMLEPDAIVQKMAAHFATGGLQNINIVMTAGPTHEAIDPIRYITNASSGKMGYALAEAAVLASAHVTLISGPTHLPKPEAVTFIQVVSAAEMYAAVMAQLQDCHIFISVAAVGDYRCQQIASEKMHKSTTDLTLELTLNPDIVATVGALTDKPFIVGFAAETENVLSSARGKLERKCMDMIIANQVGDQQGMGCDDNTVTVIDAEQSIALPSMSKRQLATELIAIIAKQYHRRSQ